MKKQFNGKVAVVTGGTQGLGRGDRAALRRARRRRPRHRRPQQEARQGGGRRHHEGGCKTVFVAADLADLAAARKIIPAAEKAFGRVDVLVNAAAITDRGTILDTSPELFDSMFDVNVRAPFFLMQDAAKLMIRKKIQGTMVNILSMSAHGGQPFIIAYSGSKGALATLTKNAAFSLMRNRIRVNGLNIGWMDTPGEERIQKLYHDAPRRLADEGGGARRRSAGC